MRTLLLDREPAAVARGRGTGLGAALVLLVLLGACTDASLYQPATEPILPDRLTVTGRVCTDDPNRQRFPVRLLFLVDSGVEMSALDPTLRRAVAVDEVVGRHATTPGLAIGVARFGGRPELLTEGFTRGLGALTEAAAGLRLGSPCVGGRCRDLAAALGLADALVTDDALSAEPGRLVRTRYVVVLLVAGSSDPSPEPDDAGCDEGCQLAAAVRETADYVEGLGAREVVVHAMLYAPPEGDPAAQARARAALEAVTFAGRGTLLVREQAELLRLSDLPLLPESDALVFRSFVVSNENARPALGGTEADSDGDGLPDSLELGEGLDPLLADSDGDGLTDGVERLLVVNGFDPLAPDAPEECEGLAPLADSDGDGLRDCEERVLGLEPSLTDGDRDGLPDGLELFAGTNPWHDDALSDPDLDGRANRDEVAEHTLALTTDAGGALDRGYRYTFLDEGSRLVPFATGPRQLTGVVVANVGEDTPLGTGTLLFSPGSPPTLAWRDAAAAAAGPAVAVPTVGRYTLVGAPVTDEDVGLDRTLTVDVQPVALPVAPLEDAVLVGEGLRTCATFSVRNVQLVETADAGRGGGWNRVRLLFGEVPRDDPAAPPVYRAAEVGVRFVAPNTRVPEGIVFLEDRDFVLLGGAE